MRLGRIRQRRRTEQPYLRVLPFSRRSHRPQHSHHYPPRQPLPPHLAPSFRYGSPALATPRTSQLTLSLSAGNIFVQTNLGTEIFDYKNNIEYPLADIPHAVRFAAFPTPCFSPLTFLLLQDLPWIRRDRHASSHSRQQLDRHDHVRTSHSFPPFSLPPLTLSQIVRWNQSPARPVGYDLEHRRLPRRLDLRLHDARRLDGLGRRGAAARGTRDGQLDLPPRRTTRSDQRNRQGYGGLREHELGDWAELWRRSRSIVRSPSFFLTGPSAHLFHSAGFVTTMPTRRWARASRTSSSRAPSTGCTTPPPRSSPTARSSRVGRTPTQTTSLPELLDTSTLPSTGASCLSGLSNVADLLSWHSVEKFYPDYFTAARPVPTGIPATLTYGGNYFDIELSAADVGDVKNLDNTIVTLVRPGFSTHAMNMGQRFVQLYVPSLPSLTSRH